MFAWWIYFIRVRSVVKRLSAIVNEQMNPYISRKLRYISFILILMVVFLHAHNISGKGDIINYYVQNIISNGITKISVALFFLISGYLFFINIPDPQWADFKKKIQSRLRTIVIPYLLWSLWGIIFFFVLQSIPYSRSYFNSDLITQMSALELLQTLFVKPLPYQLWFLRHLFTFVLLSPLIYWLAKKAKFVLLGLVAILLLKIVEIPANEFIANRSFAYFCLGCYAGLYLQEQVKARWHQFAWLALLLWLVLLFNRFFLESQSWINHRIWRNFIQHAEYFAGIFAVWSLYDFFATNTEIKKFPAVLSLSFFLYVAHEPILTITKKLLSSVIGKGSTASTMFVYFAAPILTIVGCLLLGSLLKKSVPKVYAWLVGGR